MAAKHLIIIPLIFFCVSAASGQRVQKPPQDTEEIVLTCRPQKPLSHTWICIDQFGKERNNLMIKDRDSK